MSTTLLPDGMRVRWLGHATFELVGPEPGQRFLFDPFLKNNPKFPVELDAEMRRPGVFSALIVTHPHFDHFDDVLPLLTGDPDLKVICQFEVGAWLKTQGVAEQRVVGLNTGGTVTFQGVRITMVPAVHTSSITEHGAPRALGFPIGYVLRLANGFTVYNTGDTAVTMDMQIVRDLYRPDLVILPIGDFFTMGAEQAAYALKLLEPRLAVGIHWGTWDGKPPGTPAALEQEMARYSLSTQLIKLKPGETLT
jgi:L-ascorbate metabolism protein UlaG (beta-lactamase superfamily)